MKYVKLTKLREADSPLHPDNIKTGTVKEGPFIDTPVVGKCFEVGTFWRTSIVQEIIDDKTFRTYNSIYEYEIYETE